MLKQPDESLRAISGTIGVFRPACDKRAPGKVPSVTVAMSSVRVTSITSPLRRRQPRMVQ